MPTITTTAIFQHNPGNATVLDFIGAKVDGSVDENWSNKTRKAAVQSSPSTNQHPVLQAPLLSPCQQWWKKYHIPRT